MMPDDYRSMLEYIAQRRDMTVPFDVTHAGQSEGLDQEADAETAAAYAEAGVTWWVETLNNWHAPVYAVARRLRAPGTSRKSHERSLTACSSSAILRSPCSEAWPSG